MKRNGMKVQILYGLEWLTSFFSIYFISSLLFLSFFFQAETSSAKSKRTVRDLLSSISEKKREHISFRKKREHSQFKKSSSVKEGFEKVKPSGELKVYYKEGYEAELEKLTNKSIQQLYNLSLRYKRSRGRGEIWLRLAKAYTEKSKLVELRLQEIYNKRLNAYIEKRRRKKPVLKLKEAYTYSKKAIKLYKWFIRDYPRSKKRDEALFFLGINFFKMNQRMRGEKYYLQLIKEFPKSSYVGEVYFALGEYYFELNRWKEALKNYLRVVQVKSHRAHFFVLYKVSWCYYKIGKYKKALDYLDYIIRLGKEKSRNNDDKNSKSHYIYLTNEALSSSVLFYAEGGDFRHAREYFNRHMDLEGVHMSMEKLAHYYKNSNRTQAAHYTFSNMIEDEPLSKKSFDYQYQIVSLYLSQGKSKNVEREFNKWIKEFGPMSPWHKANSKDQTFIRNAFTNMEMEYRFFILNHHKDLQRSKNTKEIEFIKRNYENYFKLFKGSPKKDEMHFFYAELLFDMKKYDESIFHYEWVIKNRKESFYYKKSFLNIILAAEKTLPSFEELEKRRGRILKKIQVDFRIKRFYRLSKDYLKAFPKAPNKTKIRYKVALLQFYHNSFVEAENQFVEIIKNEPQSKYAGYSSHLILDMYDLRKDYKGLAKASDKIISLTLLTAPKLVKKIEKIKKRNAFKILENFEKEGKDSLFVARQYEEFLEKNKTGELSVLASFNSAIFYEKEGHFIKAIQLYSKVIQSKSTSKDKKLYRNALKSRAILYEKIGQYYRAANDFVTYADFFKVDPLSQEFRYYSAKIYDGLRFYDKALFQYNKYYKRSRKKDRFEALYFIGLIWEKKSNYKKALIYYDRLMKSGGFSRAKKVELMFRIAEVSKKVGRRHRVQFWYKQMISYFRSLKDRKEKKIALRYVAESEFNLVHEVYKKFVKIKIKGSQKAQSIALQKKIGLIEKLKKDLRKVISYNDSYQIVSALTLQGHALKNMFESISMSPLPKGLKEEELEVYKKEVEKIALPFQKQFEESYQLAFEKALEFKVYGKWRIEVMNAHRKRNPSFVDRDTIEEFLRHPLKRIDYMKKYRNKKLMSKKTKTLLIERVRGSLLQKNRKDHLPSHFLDEFSKWLNKDSRDVFTLNLLAIFHLLRSEYGMAKIIFERALREKKETSRLYNNLAVLFLKRGKIREAIALLR